MSPAARVRYRERKFQSERGRGRGRLEHWATKRWRRIFCLLKACQGFSHYNKNVALCLCISQPCCTCMCMCEHARICVCVPATVRACTKCSHRQDAARCQVFVRELNAKTRKLNIARSAGAQQGVPKAWQMEESGEESGRAT